jgi:hypothetical protein
VCAIINSFKGKLITCYVILSEHTEVIKHSNPAHEPNSHFAGHSVSRILIAQNQKCTHRLYYWQPFIPFSSTTDVNTTSVEELMQDRRVTLQRVAFDLGSSYGTVQHEVAVLQHLT